MNIDLLIGGRKVAASGGATFERRNPVTGEVATLGAAKAAVDAAQAAFPKWSALGPSARRKIINKAADILEARTPDFITLVSGETGGSPGWGGFNCFLAAGMLREAASITTQVTG